MKQTIAAVQVKKYKHFHTDGLDVEVYDQRFKKGPDPLLEGDVEFYLTYACRYAGVIGRPVLELGSGTGRISWELARYGCDVVGMDYSPAMNRIAEGKRAHYPQECRKHVRFIEGDMSDFDLGGQTFPLVMIPCRSFMCLETIEQQISCLKAIHRHLDTGGYLILNLFDPRLDPHTTADWKKDMARVPVVEHPKTGNVVKIDFLTRNSNFYDQTIEEIWQYTEVAQDGSLVRQEESTLKMRWTSRHEMRHLFALCGFEVEAEYSDFYCSPPAYGKEQIWIVRPA